MSTQYTDTKSISVIEGFELGPTKNIPLYASGNRELLKRTKVSIVGSRKAMKYSREMTHHLASKLSHAGICVVSGGAIGIDAIAHKAAGNPNTIAVLPCGIHHKYPQINCKLLEAIEQEGLLLSQFQPDFQATPWSFVVRNELVVALGELLIVAEAELGSGTMRSVEFALKMGKPIYVLAHRIGESRATAELLERGAAKAIYDIDAFVEMIAPKRDSSHAKKDPFLEFCSENPSYDEAMQRFASKLFEAELSGDIEIVNGRVRLLRG
ncbi:MAG: DNA-processing protein DprA [Epsilonproteobacteria bacterium]|nr:DNA-processing protein DprA [Campylobacterota bacterium]